MALLTHLLIILYLFSGIAFAPLWAVFIPHVLGNSENRSSTGLDSAECIFVAP